MMVVPSYSDAPRLIVGDSLQDFLSLGCTIGYFFLEQLVYDFDTTLDYLFDYDAFIRQNYFGGTPPLAEMESLKAKRALLGELSKEFGLSPWPNTRAKFDDLQTKWSSQMIIGTQS